MNYSLSTAAGRVTVRRGKYEHTYTEQQLRVLSLSDNDHIWSECLNLLRMVQGQATQPVDAQAQPEQLGLFK